METMLEIIWKSFALVTVTEMGDKTQLLALVLTSRFRRPWIILLGIVSATILNHGLAAWAGQWVAQVLDPVLLKWILAFTFFGFAVWVLIPDKDDGAVSSSGASAFMVTFFAFFMAEMGDKTQLSTVALAAHFQDTLWVTTGTTLGMLAADGPAVFMGERITNFISLRWMRRIACILFALFGLLLLI